MQFRVRHRWRLSEGDRAIARTQSRGSIVVEEVDVEGGARLRVVMVRPRGAGRPDAWLVARVHLRADGRLVRPPEVLCQSDADGLERLVRHLVMPVGVDEQTLQTELQEQRMDALVEVGSRRGVRAVRARGERDVAGVELGRYRASGHARFSLLMELGDDGLSGRRRLRAEVRGLYQDSARSGGRAREGLLYSVSDTRIAIAADVETELPSGAALCLSIHRAPSTLETARRELPGAFDVQIVVAMIHSHYSAIQRCYQRELNLHPTLAGRVRVSLTIMPTGHTTAVHVLEDLMRSEEVSACLVGVIRGFYFQPGPEGGSVTYEFPFIFAPESSRPPEPATDP